MATGAEASPDGAKLLDDWHVSLKILHRAHWNASRWYEQLSSGLGVSTAVCAAIGGTSAFVDSAPAFVSGGLGLVAAILAAVQTSMRAAESAAKHKHAGLKFGQLRRDLEERLLVGMPATPAEREAVLTELKDRWSAADDESPAVPRRFFAQATRSVKEEARHAS